MYNNNEAREFITAFTGSASSNVTYQVFFDPKPPVPQRPDLANTWTSNLDNSLAFIDHSQSQYCGVYMCINGTDGLGREVSNITELRCFFVDFDGQQEPTWLIEPHLIQKRDETHGHAFWFINPGDLNADDWTLVQKRLSLSYSTDGQVIDPARVVRIPGSLHYKNPNAPATYSITHNVSSTLARYSVTDIINAHPLEDELETFLVNWSEAKKGIKDGVGYEYLNSDLNDVIGFITHAAHPAVLGSGTFELIRVSAYGHDHGIPLPVMQEIMWEHYNPRCEPPWTDNERGHFNEVILRAYKYANSAPGCKASKSGFNALPLQEPDCGWENQRQEYGPKDKDEHLNQVLTVEHVQSCRLDNNRLDVDKATVLLATLDGKAPHYDFSRVFDGINYNGTNIIRVSKQFYLFGGKTWRTVDDEVVKSQVQRMLAPYKPADSMTSGVFRCLCDLVTIENAVPGSWLTDEKKDTNNLVVFQNGIVDLGAETPVIYPHTYEFFCFNELNYSYELNATCPKWLNFLNSIWDEDEDLKRQLQQWIGYCLTRDTTLQKYAIFMGKSRGGKGVITDTISELIGDANVSSPSLSNLVKDSALDKMSTSAIAMIPDAHNVNINIRDAVLSNLKAITGEDKLSWHRMYKGGVTQKMTLKIMMSTNNIPDFNDPSGALVARMLVFPFSRSFIGKADTQLRSKLRGEIPGILQWAIAGLRELRSQGGNFTESEYGLREKEEIKEDMFPLSQYINEMCVFEQGRFTRLDDLYNAYRLWSMSNGIKTPMSRNSFNKCLRNSALDITHDRVNGERGFIGVNVKAVGASNVVGFPPMK